MTQIALDQRITTQASTSQWSRVARLAGWTALAQLACVLASAVIGLATGGEPTTASETYIMLQNNRLVGLLRLDFPTLILLCLFTVSSFGVFAALRDADAAYAGLATRFVWIGVGLAVANHSAFSLIRLSDLHAAATTALGREQLLLTGEAILAGNLWNSSAGFLAGIFMQGGFVLLSALMLRRPRFGKWTAITGILANGLDLLHVFVGLFLPSAAMAMLWAAGVFYLAWLPLLARDLLRGGQE